MLYPWYVFVLLGMLVGGSSLAAARLPPKSRWQIASALGFFGGILASVGLATISALAEYPAVEPVGYIFPSPSTKEAELIALGMLCIFVLHLLLLAWDRLTKTIPK